jgi:hypothetical protein
MCTSNYIEKIFYTILEFTHKKFMLDFLSKKLVIPHRANNEGPWSLGYIHYIAGDMNLKTERIF